MNKAPSLVSLRDALSAGDLNDFEESVVIGLQKIGHLADRNPKDIPARLESRTPIQTISMPILFPDENPLYDLWMTNAPCHSEQVGDVTIRCNDRVLFGCIEIDEAQFAQGGDRSAVCAASHAAYQQIFHVLHTKNYPHLWRTWNYIPDIHADENGLERYRQFNIGRYQAFEAARSPIDSSPAASALGTYGGKLSFAFIAGREQSTPVENPRQVSAYAYPSQYGPRSPTFSRAATVSDDRQQILFISGTASIVGHETVHRDDVAAQTRETIANLSALLAQVNASTASALTLADLTYRIYIRHARHYALVRNVFDAALAEPSRALYAQADICRADLLVEIEAFASTPLTGEALSQPARSS